jgi:aminoglycoside phosphotransferase (APT) family kinase protein
MESDKTKSSNDPDLLLGKIHVEFPELEWKSHVLITDGWDHEVIILDNKIVFRFPNDASYANSLAAEVDILSRLQPLVQANIPNYTYVANDNSFAGYSIVPGKSLTKENFNTLDDTIVQNVAKQIASLLSTLHTAGKAGLDLTNVPSSYMPDDQVEVKKLAARHLAETLNPSDYQLVETILNDVDTLLAQSKPTTFIHGDVYSNHLFWDDASQRLGLIDFSDMTIADPAIDFAELYEYGKPFVEMVFSYYEAPKDETFLARAWVYQQWVGVYMMTDHFVCHKTSFDVARETFDRVKLGNN